MRCLLAIVSVLAALVACSSSDGDTGIECYLNPSLANDADVHSARDCSCYYAAPNVLHDRPGAELSSCEADTDVVCCASPGWPALNEFCDCAAAYAQRCPDATKAVPSCTTGQAVLSSGGTNAP